MFHLWLKALHVISVIAWMAALLYLPRLFVYHADVDKASDSYGIFKIMERRLLTMIARPAMIASWVFGLSLVYVTEAWTAGWFHGKFALVIALSGYHGWLSARVRDFSENRNRFSSRAFRVANEVPTILMIGIVILVVVKPM